MLGSTFFLHLFGCYHSLLVPCDHLLRGRVAYFHQMTSLLALLMRKILVVAPVSWICSRMRRSYICPGHNLLFSMVCPPRLLVPGPPCINPCGLVSHKLCVPVPTTANFGLENNHGMICNNLSVPHRPLIDILGCYQPVFVGLQLSVRAVHIQAPLLRPLRCGCMLRDETIPVCTHYAHRKRI